MRPRSKTRASGSVLLRGLYGPHMLAFLPALCLVAFWGGGEGFLIFSALAVPLIYALAGGFGQASRMAAPPAVPNPPVEDVAREFLSIARHNGQSTACFQVEIDGLSDIAQRFGDAAADEARCLLDARLQSVLRDGDRVFHAPPAQFIVLVAPGYRLRLDALTELATRLRRALDEPLSVAGMSRYVSASIGIASSLNFGRNVTAQRWLASANQALEEAVATGTPSTRVWSDKQVKPNSAQKDLHKAIRAALDSGEFQAVFQPQVGVLSGDVTGMEALARWHHPQKGVIGPAGFLHQMSESGQMDRLGQIMLTQALNALIDWDNAGLTVPAVSVNLSQAELRNPDLPERIGVELDRTGLTAKRLVIEVLETVVAQAGDDIVRRNLVALRELGCRIDLDDFGTGHASITTLQQFPISRVKIDRSFIKDIDRRNDKRRMFAAIMAMTEELTLETIGEGVETLGEHGILQELKCGHAQGFLFAEPGSAVEMSRWLADRQEQRDPARSAVLRRVR